MSLAILVPVLGRPHRVEPLLRSIANATTGRYRVLFLSDPGDTAEHEAIDQASESYPLEHIVCGGNYAAKINEGVRRTSDPLIFLGADDLEFHDLWLERAKAKLKEGIGVVGTNDLCNAKTATGELSTHSLVTRDYARMGTIDEPDKLLHEGYPHEFVDTELVATAKHRGAYAHAPDAIVEHLHPQVGKAPMDDLYAGQRYRMRRGRRIFEARRVLWT